MEKEKQSIIMEMFLKEIFKMVNDLVMEIIYLAIYIGIKETGSRIALVEKENFLEMENFSFKEIFKMD